MKLKNKTHRNVKSSADYEGKLLNENTPFAAMEAFKTLRTNLMFTAGKTTPVFGMVSSLPNTGKSLISANTAIAFSMMEKKVLLIDCDMRKPVQHKCFKINNDLGLSDLISNQTTIEEVLKDVSDYGNLKVITSGRIPPNPQELMASESMASLLEELKTRFDVIILDLPPVSVVSDAMAIAKLVTGYVCIVHVGESEKPAFRRMIEEMRNMECNIVGVVLNFVDLKSGSYSKGGYYKNYYNYYSSND